MDLALYFVLTWHSCFIEITLTTRWSAVVLPCLCCRTQESHRNSSHLIQQCVDSRAAGLPLPITLWTLLTVDRVDRRLPLWADLASLFPVSVTDESLESVSDRPLHRSHGRGALDSIVSIRLRSRRWSGRLSIPLLAGNSHSCIKHHESVISSASSASAVTAAAS